MASIRPLCEPLARKAKDELNEIESRIPQDIEALRTWLEKERHIKSPKDDQFLVSFLRGSKYSLQRAKEKIENYFSMRQAMSEIFTNRDPLDVNFIDHFRTGTMIILPNTATEDGPRISLIRPGCYDPSKYTFNAIIKSTSLIGDLGMIEDDNCIIGGTIGILDLANVTKEHFFQLDLNLMKKLTILSQEGQPIRQKGIHYINVPGAFETVFNTIKGFMSEKNRSRIYVHSTIDSLYEHIPKYLLPAEYGGEAGTIKGIVDDLERKILEKRDLLLEWDKYGTDERLRTKKFKLSEEFYGVEGSFRKLDVD